MIYAFFKVLFGVVPGREVVVMDVDAVVALMGVLLRTGWICGEAE